MTGGRRRAPWWTVLSSAAAPVLLIGGWLLAESRQPAGFDPVRDTISALAAIGATDRAIMTVALTGVGVCHLVTALGLRSAAPAGRVVLALGGVATVAVAAFPLPAVGSSTAHVLAAGVAFGALALWPVLARQPGRVAPVVTTVVLLGLLGWCVAELVVDGPRVGLAERVLAGAQAVVPLVSVLRCYSTSEHSQGAKRPEHGE